MLAEFIVRIPDAEGVSQDMPRTFDAGGKQYMIYQGGERAEIEKLIDVLLRNGFVRCDIPACNCGSWHARYGLPERMQELADILADAGHPKSNENGHLIRKALQQLVAERDALLSKT